jgi:hypothetical protein
MLPANLIEPTVFFGTSRRLRRRLLAALACLAAWLAPAGTMLRAAPEASPGSAREAPPSKQADDPTGPADILARAVAALGGEKGLDLEPFRLAYAGRSFPNAVDQGFSPEKTTGSRFQESLVIDVAGHRGARRWESQNVDGSPTLWREGVVGDRGYRMNLKSQRRWPAATGLDLTWDNLTWRIPHLALQALRKSPESLRSEGVVKIGGRAYDALGFPLASAGGQTVTVLFDRRTGMLAGYQHPEDRMLGRLMVRTLFKPYARYRIGLLPGGYTLTIGNNVYSDLDCLDARPTGGGEDPWFDIPADEPDRPPLVVQQPSTTTEVAPGIFLMRNVGGYNTLFADLGDCVAVVDAIAQFRGATLLPSAGDASDLAAQILAQIKTTLNKPVCYVVPTHHHDDHFGGIARFAAAGATVVTSPANERIARRTLEAHGAGGGRIELVRDRTVLGSGKNAMEVRLLRGPHVEEMLFAWFPEHRLIFEGDLSDYVFQAIAFLHFLDDHPLDIETILSVHGSRPYTLEHLNYYEPGS